MKDIRVDYYCDKEEATEIKTAAKKKGMTLSSFSRVSTLEAARK